MCAFEGSNPSIAKVLQVVRDEAAAWRLAGASSLSALWPLWPPCLGLVSFMNLFWFFVFLPP